MWLMGGNDIYFKTYPMVSSSVDVVDGTRLNI